MSNVAGQKCVILLPIALSVCFMRPSSAAGDVKWFGKFIRFAFWWAFPFCFNSNRFNAYDVNADFHNYFCFRILWFTLLAVAASEIHLLIWAQLRFRRRCNLLTSYWPSTDKLFWLLCLSLPGTGRFLLSFSCSYYSTFLIVKCRDRFKEIFF